MSTPVIKSVTCPACGNTQDFPTHDRINASDAPQLRDRLISRDLITLTCTRCGTRTPVAYDLLYHDPDRRFMLWLIHDESESPPPPPPTVETYTRRTVRSANDLLEKILLLTEGRDDRLMELFKLALLGSLMADDATAGGSLYYAGTQGGNLRFIVLSPKGPQQFDVPQNQFEAFRTQFAPRLTVPEADWPLVDAAYALAILQH